jgi:hypothetical protein
MDPDDFVRKRGAQAFEGSFGNGTADGRCAVGARDRRAGRFHTRAHGLLSDGLTRLVAGIEDATVRQHYDQALKDRFYAMRRACVRHRTLMGRGRLGRAAG